MKLLEGTWEVHRDDPHTASNTCIGNYIGEVVLDSVLNIVCMTNRGQLFTYESVKVFLKKQ